jgi:hypothetical protein
LSGLGHVAVHVHHHHHLARDHRDRDPRDLAAALRPELRCDPFSAKMSAEGCGTVSNQLSPASGVCLVQSRVRGMGTPWDVVEKGGRAWKVVMGLLGGIVDHQHRLELRHRPRYRHRLRRLRRPLSLFQILCPRDRDPKNSYRQPHRYEWYDPRHWRGGRSSLAFLVAGARECATIPMLRQAATRPISIPEKDTTGQESPPGKGFAE